MRSLIYLLLAFPSACDPKGSYPESEAEPAHVFYGKHEFYTRCPKKAVFVADDYGRDTYSFSMRPIGVEFSIPKNYLVTVTHQFQPWAKKIYDVASIVVSLPNFAPRTRENSESLMKSASLDRLTIILGGLANDLSARPYYEAVQNGTLVLDDRHSSPDVPVYRKSFDIERTEPFFALPNPSKFKSPLGNDIVIICPPKGHESKNSQYPTGDCVVQIALPPSYFPSSRAETFGGVAGVSLYYYFDEKYLPQWPTLHPRLLDFLRGFIRQ